MPRWIDLEAFRRLTAAYVTEAAELAGLENVRVSVQVDDPGRRERRDIIVEVRHSEETSEQQNPQDN